ncbi:MAG: acetyltransferase [Gemmatimonadaceae bacterium]|nr:acetyltransferase [Gemmatimonadaceae bacterium]
MSKPLIIVGTGLFAEVAAAYFAEYTDRALLAFACHDRFREGTSYLDRPLVALESLVETYPPNAYDVFVAIGYRKMNSLREAVFNEVTALGYDCVSFVHPAVKIWSSSTIGKNVFIFEDNTIQPFAHIGDNTVLWSGNHIGHHSRIGRHCFISSHVVISGSCMVGDNVFMGVNATLHDGLTIGNRCLIGAGAIIAKSTQDEEVFVPASTKPFPKRSSEINF